MDKKRRKIKLVNHMSDEKYIYMKNGGREKVNQVTIQKIRENKLRRT